MRTPTGIRFADEEFEAVSRYAQANGKSFSDVVREAVRCYIAPDYGKGYLSLREIAARSGGSFDMQLAFSQFLDDFAHAKDKEALIGDEPIWEGADPGRWRYDFAATAHKLADDNGLPVPAWCMADEYFPEQAYYAFDTEDEEFRAFLRENTPREFRWRNLFLGQSILERA